MSPYLTQHYKVEIKAKWNNPRKGVAHLGEGKEITWTTFDYDRPTYIFAWIGED